MKSVYKRLRNAFVLFNSLSVELEYFDCPDWALFVRHMATRIGNLLPEQFLQLNLFDSREYIEKNYNNEPITEQPVFDCFYYWRSDYEDRKFERDLQRYLQNPNFSYYQKPPSPYQQLGLTLVFR